MSVRPVAAPDVVVWAALRHHLWPEAHLNDLMNETRSFVSDPDSVYLDAAFIAEDDGGKAIGFIELTIRAFSDGCDSMPVPHIEGWYVEPDARGNGYGRALMDAAETWCRTKGFCELASDTETHNTDSQHAHDACGFEEVERIVKFRKVLN
jgi:aminoglycoside 6'-N-acetyltransferase I